MNERMQEIKWALEKCNGFDDLKRDLLQLYVSELKGETDVQLVERFTLRDCVGEDAKNFSHWLWRRIDEQVKARRNRASDTSMWQYHYEDWTYIEEMHVQWKGVYDGS